MVTLAPSTPGGLEIRLCASAGREVEKRKPNLSLTTRLAAMLAACRKSHRDDSFVFPGDSGGAFLVSSLDRQYAEFCALVEVFPHFVIHSLRHTMLTRLGESRADAFTSMRIAGQSSVTVSQRYVHPSPESLERAFERMDAMDSSKRGEDVVVPTKSPQPKTGGSWKSQ
jgi:integrase